MIFHDFHLVSEALRKKDALDAGLGRGILTFSQLRISQLARTRLPSVSSISVDLMDHPISKICEDQVN